MRDLTIKEYFSEDGPLKATLPYFEYRKEQVIMAEHVYDTFMRRGILIAEAQTGTGKTLAYLIPAVLSGRKTVVSTGTKNLQEQIFKKDIPFLKDKLGLKFSAACMKGRANYICLKKYRHFSKQGTFEFKSDVEHFHNIGKWLTATGTGDIEELTGIPDNAPFFKNITSSSEQCSGQKCPNVKECFITKMKERSIKADIIIINHHLFFADLAVKESSDQFVVVPHYHSLVFDEAHQLEDTASSYFGITVSNYKLEELIRDLNFAVSTEKIADERLPPITDKFLADSAKFFNIFKRFSKNDETTFKLATLMKYKEAAAIEALMNLYSSFDHLAAHLDLMQNKSDDILNIIRRAKDIKAQLEFIMETADNNYVYWCETRGKGTFLKANPIDVSYTLKETLFKKQDSIVLTSATLAADNGFTYIKERLGIQSTTPDEEAELPVPDELILPSPFDFENNALHYLPVIKNEPSAPGFMKESAQHILELIKVCGGRTFVLFTSLRNMRGVHDLIAGEIPYTTLMQGEMPKSAILEEFKGDTTSVLFATMSFWGGVDVQGESLISVIIDKLPFASPGDPLVEAKINLIRENNGNPFFDFQVPQAVITLKQGLGRLIRKKDDYGILTILDKRLRTKGYGKKFIKSLPKAKISSKISDVEDFLKKFR
jgi:ATP-dependent DNA helicase DinG